MWIQGSQEMSVAPNQLLLNGKVLLTKSLHNGSNHHLHQIYQYGFPFPILPNLNSLPEKMANTGMSEAICSPSTPVNLDKNKRIQDHLPREVIDLVDESVTNENIQGKENDLLQSTAGELAGLFFSKPERPSQVISCQQQEGNNNIVLPSEGVLLHEPESGENDKREKQGIDLNKVPQQKPRRKKHRPKVIREGKPVRTPKPVTPARNKETPSGKRKYVRKKKVMNSDTPSCPLGEIVDQDSGSGTKSVRRCLNFDSEEPHMDGCLGSSLSFAWDAATRAKDACISSALPSSTTKLVVPSAQGWKVVVENSAAQITFDLNSSANQMPNEAIRIPQTPNPCFQPSRSETVRINHRRNEYIEVPTNPPPPPQSSRREIIKENLKEFAQRNDYVKIAGGIPDRSLESGENSQLDSNNTSDMHLRRTKRDHNLVDKDCVSTHINFMHSYDGIDHICQSHDMSRHDPCFLESHKRKRTEKRQSEPTSNSSSSVTCTPASWKEVFTFADAQRPMTSSWKMSLDVPNNCEVFSFADAQRLMGNEKLRSSERMLSFDQVDIKTKKVPMVPLQTNNLTSPSVNRDGHNLLTPVKPSGFNNMDCSQLSTPDKVYTEALVVKDHKKKNTKKLRMKEQNHFMKPMTSHTNQMCLQEDEAASVSYGPSYGSKSVQVTASASGTFKVMESHIQVNSFQDCQIPDISLSSVIIPHGDPVDDIVRKMKCLNINGIHEIIKGETKNALVPYGGGGGMVVPYGAPFDLIRKRRPRAKVNLDAETNRVWNLLMGKESSDEKTDKDKEKWWEEERRVFHGRVDSFIARMHLVQGDRRFSQWKGSVVDSVVGVFLTQNVSDHLSSSAFMALAARFPVRSNGDNNKPNAENLSRSTEQQESCIIASDDSIKCQAKLDQELCYQGSLFNTEVEHMAEKEMASISEPLRSNSGGSIVDYSKGEGLDIHERELEIANESHNSRTGTPITVTGSTSVAEVEDRRSTEDVVSSQNSAVSSQNSPEYLVQTADQIEMSLLSNDDAEDVIYRQMCNSLETSTSFLELLQMAETTNFQERCSHSNERISSRIYCDGIDPLACLEVETRASVLDQFDNFEGKSPSMYRSISCSHDSQHDFMSVSCAPLLSYTLNNCPNSILTTIGKTSATREDTSSHLLSTISGQKTTNSIRIMGRRCGLLAGNATEAGDQHDFMAASCAPTSYPLDDSSSSGLMATGNAIEVRQESSSHLPSTALGMTRTNINNLMGRRCDPSENLTEAMCQHDFVGGSCAPSQSYHLNFSRSRLNANRDANAIEEESGTHFPSTASGMVTANNIKTMGRRSCPLAENSTEATKTAPAIDIFEPISKHSGKPLTCSEKEVCVDEHSFYHSNLPGEKTEASSGRNTSCKCSQLRDEQTAKFQQKEGVVEFQVKSTEHAVRTQAQMQSDRIIQTCLNSHNNLREISGAMQTVESNLKDEANSFEKVSVAPVNSSSKIKKVKPETDKTKTYDWDNLRKQACRSSAKKERSSDTMDSLDWEAIRCADVSEISQAIRERGMNNMLAERIKAFLNRVVQDHGSIDLEWLRDVPPDKAKDYLLSIRGLGLKSVECVRLLTLHHLAFPVDTNVGRICVRLGWVPLQPLPESLQLHLLEMYPILETIQKYLWPRLCKLDQRTLYELHYQMITFGKVFCTKSKPNCNACPMRGECKHFASAFASARFALPGPEEKSLVSSTSPIASETCNTLMFNPIPLPRLKGSTFSEDGNVLNNCEPIIEEPATPEPELSKTLESDIEDAFYEDPDEIPIIKLNLEKFTENVHNYMQENNMELQHGDLSKALVTINPEAASIPMPKLKNVSRLRTEHQVYELPDSHPLLQGLDPREPDDPCSYLLAIWSPGETAQSTEPPEICCNSQDTGKLCDKKTCFGCNNIREAHAQTVRGTLLIPCRTAMRGSFPLNGTYFQVNEVFADHDSSCNPINVPREWIWSLPRRTVYFGTSIPTIFKGLTTEGIQQCFWRGFVCVRGFDRTTRAPKPLYARLHFPASKTPRNSKAAAAAAAAAAARKEE